MYAVQAHEVGCFESLMKNTWCCALFMQYMHQAEKRKLPRNTIRPRCRSRDCKALKTGKVADQYGNSSAMWRRDPDR